MIERNGNVSKPLVMDTKKKREAKETHSACSNPLVTAAVLT